MFKICVKSPPGEHSKSTQCDNKLPSL